MPRGTRSKKVVTISESEHYSDSTATDDESTPVHQVQVVITNKPNTKTLRNVTFESSESENDSVSKGGKDTYQPTSSEEESEGLSDSSEYSNYSNKRNKRKLPRRHVTSKKINYSEEKYYKKVHKVFDDFHEVISSEEELPPTKQRKVNDDSSRPKRRPKRKSAKKLIDYDEKGYYKKFETALNARLH
ncbi:5606_t:CDS:2 [Dentiscutata erythropus]|uniref:5606_t:CDS:1 n=1 Tax=Dentiscutata erythropus TaxID=1348616 RepID=A0A9N9JD61_9GLOM|nr:5606_t:CDS:2 [Dentiscutata erythropus]